MRLKNALIAMVVLLAFPGLQLSFPHRKPHRKPYKDGPGRAKRFKTAVLRFAPRPTGRRSR